MIPCCGGKSTLPHSLTCALINFFVLACQTGWRGIPRSGKLELYEYDDASRKFKNIIYACCIKDFTFKQKYEKTNNGPNQHTNTSGSGMHRLLAIPNKPTAWPGD